MSPVQSGRIYESGRSREGVFLSGWRSAVSLLQDDTLTLQQRAGTGKSCVNRQVVSMKMSMLRHVDSCCEARDANGSALYVLGQLRLSD